MKTNHVCNWPGCSRRAKAQMRNKGLTMCIKHGKIELAKKEQNEK